MQGVTRLDLNHYVSEVTKFFDWARGGATSFATSQALFHLYEQACRRNPTRPSLDQRDTMVSAITRARPHILEHLAGERIDRDVISTGLDAAQGLAMLWAETDEERAERHPCVAQDLIAHARILRHDLSSADLFRGIRTRATQRQHDEVSRLHARFDKHFA